MDNVIDYATQICEGLRAAHQAGIIHRDIKPENILIDTSGRVKILDFGLARMKGVTKLTKDATTLGTLRYMSPEQYQNKEVDHRTDIWSFGVVLFEMLTGQVPFQGEYEAAVMYSVVNEEPKAVSSIRKDIPQNLEQIVGKSLEKDPAMRYQSMQEVLEELKKPLSSVRVNDKKEKSIIVLPFDDMSPDRDNEYFSDGLTEEIIADLSKIHDLLVISRSSAMTFKGTKKKIKEIAKEVNVRYVLEGSVRKAGNNLRITAQLIDSTRDAHLWAEKYSGTLDDVFEIQENVSRSIVDALKMKLSPDEIKKIVERPIENIQAYECYLKANAETFKFTEEAINNAIRNIQHALDIMGDNVLLYASMAIAYFQLVNIGAEQEDSLVKAEEYARKALSIDPDHPKALTTLGVVHSYRNPSKSVYYFKKALAVNPDDSDALKYLAVVYIWGTGKISAAIPLCEKFMKIDPFDFLTNINHVGLYFYDGQFDRALQAGQGVYEMYPGNPMVGFYYSLCLAYNKRIDKTFLIIDQFAKTDPNNAPTKLALMLKFVCQKDKESAFRIMTPDFKKTCQRDASYGHHLAGFFAMLNEKKEALDWLENAINCGFINYPLLSKKDPFLENIRGEERFKKLMERVKHEWENFEV